MKTKTVKKIKKKFEIPLEELKILSDKKTIVLPVKIKLPVKKPKKKTNK